jgi:hypothetical protein
VSNNVTGNQLGFITRLLEERTSHVPEGVPAFLAVIQNKRLTSKGASILIDKLLSIPADAKPVDPTAPVSNRDLSRRSNAYPGKCIKCGHEVGKGAGYLTGSRAAGWGCEHLDGECPTGEVEAPTHKLSEIIGDLPDGRYAIPAWTENNDISFWTIGTNQGVYNPEKKGQRWLRQVTGHHGDEGIERLSNAIAEKVVAGIRANGLEESGRLYGREIGQCCKCGRTLTSQWRKEGIGPECSKKGY